VYANAKSKCPTAAKVACYIFDLPQSLLVDFSRETPQNIDA